MSLGHSTFLFDYQSFRLEVMPLLKALDEGNPEPLHQRVLQIRASVPDSKKWILHDRGTEIGGDFGLDRDPQQINRLWGHWLLIVLSTYLQPGGSLIFEWTTLSSILNLLNWSEKDRLDLLAGIPTVLLLKPNTQDVPKIQGRLEAPYWYWVAPIRCYRFGWLPLEEVDRLLNKLVHDQVLIDTALLKQIPKVIQGVRQPGDVAYQRAIDMLRQAKSANVGLFSIITERSGDIEEEDEID